MKTSNNPLTILYVDDEEHNLSAFKASFRRKHNVLLARSGSDGIEILKQENPQIIIADQRMPGLTGVEFFEKIKETYPDPIRILLTAYTSSQTVIDAVNKGQIDRYLVKPWSSDIMDSTLQTGQSMYETRLALRKKNEALKKINSELNRFVYSVSHDLRAPLMSLLGLINLVKLEDNPNERFQFYDLMEKSVHKMDAYIQTTLDYYRNFKTELNLEPVQVDLFINEIVDALRGYNDRVEFELNISGDKEIYTDKNRLKISLSNILSNAVKYGDKTGVDKYKVVVGALVEHKILTITVQDFGHGIDPSEIPLIFEMFYRSPRNTDTKSTGLGLYLVKEAITRIKGHIDVESIPGEGTIFKLQIPDQKNE